MQDEMEPEAAAKTKGGRKAGGAKAGGAKAGGAKAGGKGKGAGKDAAGGKTGEVQIARMLVRAQWLQEWTIANPDAAQADRKAAWKDARAARLETDLKTARRIISLLQRQGVNMTLTAAAAADADGDGADV